MSDAIDRQPADSPPRHLTRTQVAKRLGVSVATVRRMEGKELHPTKDENGVRLFEPAEVESIGAARSPGPPTPSSSGILAATVFTMLDQKKTLREIVIALKAPPEVIRALYREWSMDLTTGEKERRRAELHAAEEQQRRQMEAEEERYRKQAEREQARIDEHMQELNRQMEEEDKKREARMEAEAKRQEELLLRLRKLQGRSDGVL
jgi:hypothetical protein